MIKIIKHGNQYYTLECPECGCQFRCVASDFSYCVSSAYYKIKCPECEYALIGEKVESIGEKYGK